MNLLLSLFCMVVWAVLAATVASVLAAVLAESCGAGHTVTAAVLVVTFSAAVAGVFYLWQHD